MSDYDRPTNKVPVNLYLTLTSSLEQRYGYILAVATEV